MADVKQIEVNGVTYDICDAVARQDIANLQQSVSQILDTKNINFYIGSVDNITANTASIVKQNAYQVYERCPVNEDKHTITLGVCYTTQMGVFSYLCHKYPSWGNYGVMICFSYDGFAFMLTCKGGTYSTRDLI